MILQKSMTWSLIRVRRVHDAKIVNGLGEIWLFISLRPRQTRSIFHLSRWFIVVWKASDSFWKKNFLQLHSITITLTRIRLQKSYMFLHSSDCESWFHLWSIRPACLSRTGWPHIEEYYCREHSISLCLLSLSARDGQIRNRPQANLRGWRETSETVGRDSTGSPAECSRCVGGFRPNSIPLV